MNVLVLSNNDSGLYQFRSELIEHLSKNHNVICSVPNSDGFINKLENLGCKCIPIEFNRRGTNPIKDLQLLIQYKKLIDDTSPDVVLTYTIKPNVYGGMACQIKEVPYLANITGLGTTIENGGILSKISLTLYRIGLRKAKCVFFQNAQNNAFFKNKHIVGDNARLIPGSGVNVKTHQLEEYPDQKKQFRFLFVGRVMKDKGIEELLKAIVALSTDYKDVFLEVVGGCDEDYSKMLTEYEDRGLIKYYGQQNDVHDFYKRAHCVVLPSYHEGMANVMLEAASTGRPVITSRIPGCQETFDEGITGFGCESKNVESLIDAMRKMYSASWEERKLMGLEGRKKVKKEFDRQIIVKAYENEINSVKCAN